MWAKLAEVAGVVGGITALIVIVLLIGAIALYMRATANGNNPFL